MNLLLINGHSEESATPNNNVASKCKNTVIVGKVLLRSYSFFQLVVTSETVVLPGYMLSIASYHFRPLVLMVNAQMAQTVEFMSSNVAYRATVYRSGAADCL